MNETRSMVVQTGEGLTLHYQRARLLVEAGPDQGLEVDLADRMLVLGRADDADLQLADPAISRAHAAVEPDGRGWRVRDLGSKSGTRLNGVTIDQAPLPEGGRIRIGATELVFRCAPVEVPSPRWAGGEFHGMIGASPAMRELFGLIERVAETDLPVLVLGESGTGKEGVARALHTCSPLADAPYEVVDCTLLEREHMRSELFGHAKGAFTGATAARQGAFERAHGGTLFLDEIAELPLALQPPFLRALEQGEVRGLGADRARRVQVRVVAATNRDLVEESRNGTFREDLYYRLSAITVTIPPLRDRGDDVLLLARRFLPPGRELSAEAAEGVRAYPWPGNVRELRFKMQRAAALGRGAQVELPELGLDPSQLPTPPPPPTNRDEQAPDAGPRTGSLASYEERAIRQALQLFDGNKPLAAEHLGIGRSTLYRRLKEYGIE